MCSNRRKKVLVTRNRSWHGTEERPRLSQMIVNSCRHNGLRSGGPPPYRSIPVRARLSIIVGGDGRRLEVEGME